jgi:hypothetical protein
MLFNLAVASATVSVKEKTGVTVVLNIIAANRMFAYF